MDEKQLLSIVNEEFENSLGAPGGEISVERAAAHDFYLSKLLRNEVEGESQIVTSEVSDVVDSIMPSLLRIFTTAENAVSFDPVGPEDIEAAQQETDYVNYIFFKRNPSFLILYTWFFDALVQKNGIVKAWWDESEEVSQETYEGLSDDELLRLAMDDELEIVSRETREVEFGDPASGEVRSIVNDVTFKRVRKTGRVRIENVAPEEYRISNDAKSVDPSSARMVGQIRELPRSDLIYMGFDRDIVESLPADRLHNISDESYSRRDRDEERSDSVRDKSQDIILVKEAYIRVDYDDDGRSELRHVIVAGNEVLVNEIADRQPFHVISPQPMPHKHFGRATAEKVMDLQLVNTTLLRQILNNIYHTNRPSHAIWEHGVSDDTIDALLDPHVGKIIPFQRPIAESYSQISIPFTAGSTFQMLEYFDRVKRDRTGISSDSQGLTPEDLKNIQTTVLAQANDIGRMKVEAIARIFAETGLKSLFLHIHELLQKHQNKAEIIQLRNNWVQVDPANWRKRMDMTVNVGLGVGTREQNLIHLNAIWDKQKDIISAGGFNSLVTPQNIYNTAAEFVKNANLKQPDLYFTRADQIPPAPPDEESEIKMAQIKLAERQQQIDAERQRLEQEKILLEHSREVEKIKQKQEEIDNRFAVDMEKVRTQLTELELKFNSDIPGSKA